MDSNWTAAVSFPTTRGSPCSSRLCFPRRQPLRACTRCCSRRCRLAVDPEEETRMVSRQPFWCSMLLGKGGLPFVSRSEAKGNRLILIVHHLYVGARRTVSEVAQAPKEAPRPAKPKPPRPVLSGPRGCRVGSPSFGVDAIARCGPNLLPMSSGSNT